MKNMRTIYFIDSKSEGLDWDGDEASKKLVFATSHFYGSSFQMGKRRVVIIIRIEILSLQHLSIKL